MESKGPSNPLPRELQEYLVDMKFENTQIRISGKPTWVYIRNRMGTFVKASLIVEVHQNGSISIKQQLIKNAPIWSNLVFNGTVETPDELWSIFKSTGSKEFLSL